MSANGEQSAQDVPFEGDDGRLGTRRVRLGWSDDDDGATAGCRPGEHGGPAFAQPQWIWNDDHTSGRRQAVQHGSRDGRFFRAEARLVMHGERARDAERPGWRRGGSCRDPEWLRDLIGPKTIRGEHASHRVARLERRSATHPVPTVLPRRAGVMLTNADAGREQLASVGIGLREIVEHELAMVSAHIVGRERTGRQNPRAAKGEVARQDDVHVHLDDLGQPRCAAVRRYPKELLSVNVCPTARPISASTSDWMSYCSGISANCGASQTRRESFHCRSSPRCMPVSTSSQSSFTARTRARAAAGTADESLIQRVNSARTVPNISSIAPSALAWPYKAS